MTSMGATTQPIAITNCLNFGNPHDPEIYWQFEQAVAGIGDACRVLDTPVTGGNVSFYNETEKRTIYPTPIIAMVSTSIQISPIHHLLIPPALVIRMPASQPRGKMDITHLQEPLI